MPESWLCQKVEEIDDRLQTVELGLHRRGIGVGSGADLDGGSLRNLDIRGVLRIHPGGEIRVGDSGTPDGDFNGVRIYRTNDPYYRLEGQKAGDVQFYVDNNGVLRSQGSSTGNYITLEKDGLWVRNEGNGSTYNLKFRNSDVTVDTGYVGFLTSADDSPDSDGRGTMELGVWYDADNISEIMCWKDWCQVAIQSGGSWTFPLQVTTDSVKVEGDLGVTEDSVIGKGLYVGNTSGTPTDNDVIADGDMEYYGGLISRKNSTTYPVYGMYPYAVPLTSTDWNGDTKETTDSGTIDLSAVFGVPAGVKAVFVRVRAEENVVGTEWTFGPDSSNTTMIWRAQVSNVWLDLCGMIPCDANGDIYCSFSANVDSCYLWITGYAI